MTTTCPVIITPTARLANAVGRAIDQQQLAGATGWLRPHVMAWPAWIQTLLADWLLQTDDPRVPLTDEQAQLLWSDIIGRDVFSSAHRVARQARHSWARLHQWCLPAPEQWPDAMLSDDARQFQSWAAAYRSRLKAGGWLDRDAWQAELPERIAAGELGLPETIVLHGFELPLEPLQARIIEALEAGKIVVEHAGSQSSAADPVLVKTPDPQAELELAAHWAREKIESGARQVAIVIPNIESRLADIDRILRQVLTPDAHRLHNASTAPWHLSLGLPVAQWPLGADALRILGCSPKRLDLLELSALLRSPFLAGWQSELDARAWLDARLRQLPGDAVTLFRVNQMMADPKCNDRLPTLSQGLTAWKHCHHNAPDQAPPSAWAQQFAAELDALGFAKGRALDSIEYQLTERWQTVLEQLAALDPVSGHLRRTQALARLTELAAARTFREQNPGAPIEVMGLYEALGGQFDAVRVLGLDEDSWPPPARPDPLIPRPLQAERMEATAAGQLEQARLILQCLARTGAEVIFSWPGARDGEPVAACRLLQGPALEAALPAGPPKAELEQAVEDYQAPPHPGGPTRGGTGLLKSQSECPFKAFATRRLNADELRHPRPGLDAMARGSLLHKALELFWNEVKDSTTLQALLAGESGFAADEEVLAGERRAFDTIIRGAVHRAISRLLDSNRLALNHAQTELETQRLTERLKTWLQVERQRPPFRVTQTEQWMELKAGSLTLRGMLDRVDELEDGRRMLIDYKSGNVEIRGWVPEPRLHDPQLPLYCLNMDPPPVAIAFARLRPDQLDWQGIAKDDLRIQGIRPLDQLKGGSKFADIDEWNALMDDWRERISALADGFVAGDASVAPREPGVCEYCHLGTLCRIRERTDNAT